MISLKKIRFLAKIETRENGEKGVLRPKISRNRVVNSVEDVMEREEENFFSTIYSRYESHCPLVADRMWEANVKAKHTRRNPPTSPLLLHVSSDSVCTPIFAVLF